MYGHGLAEGCLYSRPYYETIVAKCKTEGYENRTTDLNTCRHLREPVSPHVIRPNCCTALRSFGSVLSDTTSQPADVAPGLQCVHTSVSWSSAAPPAWAALPAPQPSPPHCSPYKSIGFKHLMSTSRPYAHTCTSILKHALHSWSITNKRTCYMADAVSSCC